MAWEVVKVDDSKVVRGIPRATVGYGRISLNVAACNLLHNFESYKFAELLMDKSKRPTEYGIKFLVANTQDSIAIKRKVIKGKVVGGIEVASMEHVGKLFGEEGRNKFSTHYSVTLDKTEQDIVVLKKIK